MLDDPTVVVALITVIGSVTAAFVTSYFTATRQLTQLQVKVDLLWKTYIVDAVAASREAGMVATKSPEQPTEHWENTLPNDLRRNISKNIKAASEFFRDPYDVSLEVLNVMRDELIVFSIKSNITMKEILGTIYVMSLNYLNGRSEVL